MAGVRVVLTEGSSLTSREVVTSLGPCGYRLEVLDPNPMCLARFSRWVRLVDRCPHAGTDPLGYLRRLAEVVADRAIDVVFPATSKRGFSLPARRCFLPRSASRSRTSRLQTGAEQARLRGPAR